MSAPDRRRFDIPFVLRGAHGTIRVTMAANDDPLAVGCEFLLFGESPDVVLGYPVCMATVDYERDGYAAVLGWTQLVRSSDNATSGESFEVDPIAVYRDVDTPFAWYGIKPTLFDAPFRFDKQDIRWECYSFLCLLPDAVLTRRVRAITGFSWGFDIRRDTITQHVPAVLDGAAWNGIVSVLGTAYPNWTFDEDLHDK